MRVTENMRFAATHLHQSRVAGQMVRAANQASTGIRVAAPSDDPGAYAAVTNRDAQIVALSSRQKAMSRARGDLELAESTLASAGSLMIRARELAVAMANGEVNAGDRTIAGLEVAHLREQLLGLANAQGQSGHLFAGTATNAPPFTPAGAFVGNDGVMQIEIADGVLSPSNISGAQAFTALGGQDLFQVLSDLEAALLADNGTAIANAIDTVDAGHRQLLGARADAGLAVDRMLTAEDVTSSSITKAKTARANLSEVDATTAISELVTIQAAYERNLAVTRQLLSLSLVNRF